MSILDNEAAEQQQDAVQLMTIHAAKGLEFEHVYLVGFEEDSLPHHQSQDDEGIEEERRLAYVGITCAQKTLTMTHAKRRTRYGDTINCDPSRFIDELPDELLERDAKKPADSDEARQAGKATLAGLRDMLQKS